MEEFLTHNTIKEIIYNEFNKEVKIQDKVKKLV